MTEVRSMDTLRQDIAKVLASTMADIDKLIGASPREWYEEDNLRLAVLLDDIGEWSNEETS